MPDQTASDRELSVGELARLSGISVRTLHHYDEIGLLRPSARQAGGRRSYAAADAARLARILGYRALDLPLDRIAALLDGQADENAQLREQLAQLDERITRLSRIRDHVRISLEAHDMSIDLTPAERLEVFGDDDPTRFEAEARERWGDTEAWRESRARAKGRSKDDWLRITSEQEAGANAFAEALRRGEPSGGPAVHRRAVLRLLPRHAPQARRPLRERCAVRGLLRPP